MFDADAVCANLRGMVLRGRVASYEIGERIRHLDHEWVFEAVHIPTRRPVLVVACHPRVVGELLARQFSVDATALFRTSGDGPATLSRVLDEIRLLGPDDLPLMVLEAPRGTTLALKLRAASGVGLRAAFVRRVVSQIVGAVSWLHTTPFVHRRITPSNLWLEGDDDHVMVTLSLFRRFTRPMSFAANPGDRRGAVLLLGDDGDTPYLAPEVLDHAKEPGELLRLEHERVLLRTPRDPWNGASPASDVFSIAVLVFEMLAGTRPFPAQESWTVGLSELGKPRSLADCFAARRKTGTRARRSDGIMADLEATLAAGLAARPSDRPTPLQAFWSDLKIPLAGAIRLRRRAAQKAAAPVVGKALVGRRAERPPPSGVRRCLATSGKIWTFVRPPKVPLAAAAFSPDGERIVAVGLVGVVAWIGADWRNLRLPSVDPKRLSAVTLSAQGEVVVGGKELVAWIPSSGPSIQLRVPCTVRGVLAEPTGHVWYVGDQPIVAGRATNLAGDATVGVFGIAVDKSQERFQTVRGTTRLSGIARMSSSTYVACGDGGAVVLIDDYEPFLLASPLSRALSAVATREQYSLAVGELGTIVTIADGKARHELSGVADTLTCVAFDETGAVWAAGKEGVIARLRDARWETARLLDMANAVGMWVGKGRVRIVFSDGALIEGVD